MGKMLQKAVAVLGDGKHTNAMPGIPICLTEMKKGS